MSHKRLFGWLGASAGVRFWASLFFISGVLVTLACNRLLAPQLADAPNPMEPSSAPKAGNTNDSQSGAKGPWGMLEYEALPLENFDGMFPEGSGRLKPPRWVFENLSLSQLKDLLKSCHFTAAQKIFLFDTNRWEPLPRVKGFAIAPTDTFIQGLSRETRQTLYPLLGQNNANYPQALAYHFEPDQFAERFAGSGLSAERIEMLRSQTYTNEGKLLCLCVDRPLQGMLTPIEFDQMLRSLFTIRTWRVSLKITPESDLDGLAKYWGRGGRERVIRPLLESLARNGENGGRLNISYFLPPFARMRLYTFPDAYPDREAMQEDCFYTALNFFSDEPDQKLVDTHSTSQVILTRYAPTEDHLQFGDLLLFKDGKGNAIHICVFLADDFVYTKNGTGPAKPWVIMKIHDMMADYDDAQPLHSIHLRHRDS